MAYIFSEVPFCWQLFRWVTGVASGQLALWKFTSQPETTKPLYRTNRYSGLTLYTACVPCHHFTPSHTGLLIFERQVVQPGSGEVVLEWHSGSYSPFSSIRGKSASVASGKKATASNVFQKMVAEFGPDKAFDDESDTRWATDAGTHQAWLEVDLGEAKTVGSAMIAEADFGRRVRKFELQVREDGNWRTLTKWSRSIRRTASRTGRGASRSRRRAASARPTGG